MIQQEKVKKTLMDTFYVYIFGGLIGSAFEILIVLITQGVLEDRSGTIITHVNPVYGIGAVLIYLFLYGIKRPFVIYVLSIILCGFTEYILNFLQGILLRSESWDYSQFKLNIGGRTNLVYMMVFALLSLAAVKVVFPFLLGKIHMIPQNTLGVITTILLVLVAFDLVLSCGAMIRYSQRAEGMMFDNGFIRWFDGIFDNGFMKVHYPNMRVR